MCLKPKIAGYIYLTRTAAFRNNGETIYKLGKTMEYGGRFNGYDKFSELYVIYYVEDIDVIENILLQIFNRKYKNETAYGKEYFNGNVIDMLNTMKGMLDVYGLIHKVNLINSLINNKLKRFIIYNSEEINNDVYKIIKDIMIDKNINIQINDVSNYNNFYTNFIINNKNIKELIIKDIELNENKLFDNKLKQEFKEELEEESEEESQELEEKLKQEYEEESKKENILIKNDIKKELLYICHYCIKYSTQNRKDMVKHFNRKNNCSSNNLNITYEKAKILTLEKRFYFYFDIKKLTNDDFKFIITNYNNKENFLYEIYKNIHLENKIINNEFNKKYINNKTDTFECNKCFTKFMSKQSLIKHKLSGKRCNYIEVVNKILQM